MTLQLDVFWSFRSPYSYLATCRLVRLEERYDLALRIRPVYPLAIRKPEFFAQVNPLWPRYLARDIRRVAEFHGLPLAWPRPDPVRQRAEGGRLVTEHEQPLIHRLTRLGQLASERGRGLPFIDEVSKLIWSGAVQDWDQGDHLARATARAGLDLTELDPIAAAEASRLDGAIADHQSALEAAGHWGVPTFVFEGEPFFGQDRLELLLWRLQQHGLKER